MLMVLSLSLAIWAVVAQAQNNIIKSHGYSFFGELKYPADFEHLDYVNPDAPKGGEISVWFPGTFDSMNPYTRKGQAGYLSNAIFERLMTSPSDEVEAMYGLIAESLEYPETKEWVIFNLRPEARFSDGTPVTAEDVVFTHNLFLEQGLPSYRESVKKRILGAEALGPHRVKFTFAPDIPRRGLIGSAGATPVMSKAWFERTGAKLDESRLDPGIGTGAYVVDEERMDVGRRIVYKRNPDYWGNDLPINRGTSNFDSIRVEYFADSVAAFEGFKAGEYTFRQETSSRTWATGYDFPSLDRGDVVKYTLPNQGLPLATGWVFNLDRPQFSDIRVREAIGLAYNFTWTNQSLQFGLFSQRHSFFQGTELEATGVPEGAELALLENLGDLIDPSVLTEPPVMAHTSGERQLDRRNLRKASALLDEAGWTVGDDGLRRNSEGETLSLTLLENSPTFDRITLPFVENLKAMGIDANYDRIDPAQFTNRSRARDYDMVYDYYRMALRPSTALYQLLGSDTAETSVFNPAGYSSEAADELIEAIVGATTLEELFPAARALDRLLRAERFLIPVWYNDKYWVSHYDMYERPEIIPAHGGALGHLGTWWYNAEKAEALRASGALR
jgi:microcin C transport system substrate-binding protein